MLASFAFDRKQKVYRVTGPDGVEDGETYPSGDVGKQQAFRRAVYLENPRLYQMVMEAAENAPAIAAYFWRAAEIVLNEGVRLVLDGDIFASVQSGNAYGDYLIGNAAGELTCDCESFTGVLAVYDSLGRVCKHTLATRFYLALQTRDCYHCKASNPAENMTCTNCGQAVEPF